MRAIILPHRWRVKCPSPRISSTPTPSPDTLFASFQHHRRARGYHPHCLPPPLRHVLLPPGHLLQLARTHHLPRHPKRIILPPAGVLSRRTVLPRRAREKTHLLHPADPSLPHLLCPGSRPRRLKFRPPQNPEEHPKIEQILLQAAKEGTEKTGQGPESVEEATRVDR